MKAPLSFLEYVAYDMRKWSIKMSTQAGSGHPTSALSAADIVAVLFFEIMKYDPDNFENPNNDRFILSKGHASPILYAAWKMIGKLSEDDLLTYRHFGSALEGHPTLRFPYTEAATGSLGIGLSIGVGEALCAKLDGHLYKTYVLLGDSEMSEGAIWEAIQIAAFYRLNNLVGIIDCNRLGQSTPTMEALEGDPAERFSRMVSAFGWQTAIVDGHNIKKLIDVFRKIDKSIKPVMIIARTEKGYGINFVEGKQGFHGKSFDKEEEKKALKELSERFKKASEYAGSLDYQPEKPITEKFNTPHTKTIIMPNVYYEIGERISTRKAYGQALVALGSVAKEVVCLDAEVKNSTYAELFEKAYPQRFVQCFIAEQNMVSMGVGFNRRGKIPFISTFGCFFTRAHDQIRMAAIGAAALRIVGSHAGVSIGQDGPSQMALEDIAMMRAIPNSIVLYSSDAVSTYKLVNQMACYNDGISYLRTTRMATPVIYKEDEAFPLGGCKVIRQSAADQVCVIGAGITLHEILKAYDSLKREGIAIAVIDLYSIKPLDVKTICAVAKQSKKRIITVEDHYLEGGLGEAVASAISNNCFIIKQLAVERLPRSGKPEELMSVMGIDAANIMKQVHALMN